MPSASTSGTVVMEPQYEGTLNFLSAAQVQALYDISEETWTRLRQGPWLPDPDIIVGRAHGWSEERAVRFGRETGRLDERNRPHPAFRRGKPGNNEVPPEWYRIIPARYMTGVEASLFMQLNKDGMFRLRRRGDYPTPAVSIGNNPKRLVYGWDKETCLKFALRRGYIRPERPAQIREEMRKEEQLRRAGQDRSGSENSG